MLNTFLKHTHNIYLQLAPTHSLSNFNSSFMIILKITTSGNKCWDLISSYHPNHLPDCPSYYNFLHLEILWHWKIESFYCKCVRYSCVISKIYISYICSVLAVLMPCLKLGIIIPFVSWDDTTILQGYC